MASIVSKEQVPYRVWNKASKVWNELKFLTTAKSVNAADGKTLETKVGAVDGITSDINGTSTNIAASIKVVNSLNSTLNTVIGAGNKHVEVRNVASYGTNNERMSIDSLLDSNAMYLRGVHYPANSTNHDGYIGLYFDGTNFYVQGKKNGADTVTKKLGESINPSLQIVVGKATTYGWQCDLTGISGYENLKLYENIFPITDNWRTAVNTGGTTGATTTYSNGIVNQVTNDTNAKPNAGKCYVITW